MASYDHTAIDATRAELTGEISASDLSAALEQLQVRGVLVAEPAAEATSLTRRRIREVRTPAVWKVYAALGLAVCAFLLAVLLMAAGVVGTPHT